MVMPIVRRLRLQRTANETSSDGKGVLHGGIACRRIADRDWGEHQNERRVMRADKHFTYKGSGVDVAPATKPCGCSRKRLRSITIRSCSKASAASAAHAVVPPIKDAVLVAGTDGAGNQGDPRPRDGRVRHDRSIARRDAMTPVNDQSRPAALSLLVPISFSTTSSWAGSSLRR